MHGNSEMQKINQTSAMPEKTDVHWSGRFSVAPMLDWTDRHCRYFLRLLSRNTLLYTEMVTTGAIIHGKGDYLAYSEEEHPVALQLGGSDPAALAQCAKLAEARGYDEINLNVGCPSDRVQNGMFGPIVLILMMVFKPSGLMGTNELSFARIFNHKKADKGEAKA